MKQAIILSALLLGACDDQVDGDHQGTALAELRGNVTDQRVAPTVVSADVIVLYAVDHPGQEFVVGERATVSSQFPAQFEIDIFEPPADLVLNTFEDGSRVAVGYLMAVREGIDLTNEAALEQGFLGLDPNHMLLYTPTPIVANTQAGDFFHGTYEPGFHILDVRRLTDQELAAREACEEMIRNTGGTEHDIYAQCGGKAVFDDLIPSAAGTLEVRLVDGPEDAQFPNWM